MQTRRAVALLFSVSAVVLGVGLVAEAAFVAPLRASRIRGMVAADNRAASQAGAKILAQGGNAVDAAVATALALGVVDPVSSGLGGGGFLLYWDAKAHAATALDFRETAPARARSDMYVAGGKVVPERSRWGGLAVAVPGEPAGLAAVEAKFGKLGLERVAAPALALARGFPVTPYLAHAAQAVLGRGLVLAGDPLHALLAPHGHPLAAGERLARPRLARTIALLAARGEDGFYKGEVARAIASAVRKKGGILTEADLAGYRPIWREALHGHFRGRDLYTVPPPAGGLTTLETLQILDARPPLGPLGAGSSAADHQIAEALKHAFADRARSLGDPAFVKVPTEHFADPAYARELAARISDAKVEKVTDYGDKALAGPPAEAPHDHGTSHLCVADGAGNVVALTTTVNLYFGALLAGGDSGVLLNDEMDDFAAQPGVPNQFGLIGGFANSIAPGKRPLSSMSPLVVVQDGQAVMCAGASGGPTIVSSTVQAVVNVIDFGMDATAAVSSPRIHTQWMPEELYLEEGIPRDVWDNLKKRGQKVAPAREHGAAQVIVLAPDHLEGASDPRKGGEPAAP